MTRAQLEHIIAAASAIANGQAIVVIGSQAILGSYPNAPAELLRSMEADVFPIAFPDQSIAIDGAIGELSMFHETFGYYAHGVDDTTATLPAGWRDRLVRVESPRTRGATGWCLDPYDLAVSKVAAGRENDVRFVSEMLRANMLDPDELRSLLQQIPELGDDLRASVIARLERLISERGSDS